MKLINILPFILFLLLFISCNINEESRDKEEITKLFDVMSGYLVNGDYEKIYEISYPGSFEGFTKQEVLDDLKSQINTPVYDVVVKQVVLDSISSVFANGEKKYALVTSHSKGSFIFKPGKILQTGKTFDQHCENFLKDSSFTNVECDSVNQTFNMVMKDYLIFIYLNIPKKWYILSSSNPKNIDKFVPEEIRTKLKM